MGRRRLIELEQARSVVLMEAAALAARRLPLRAALGMVLAEDIVAGELVLCAATAGAELLPADTRVGVELIGRG